jgi:rhodanese-related sulfurtransferase
MRSKLLLLVCIFLLPGMAGAEIVNIDNTQLKELIAQKVPLVDIRTAPEWTETGVVEGSHMLTFFDVNGNYDARAFLAQLAPIADKGEPVILICRTGRRTGIISKFMNDQVGYQIVYNVTKGIRHWIDTENPVVAPE